MAKPWTRWDERTRLIAAAGVCGALLILAALLPLAFRRRTEGTGEEKRYTAEEKAALFTEYWSGGGAALAVEKLDAPSGNVTAFCESVMAGLTERCINDQALDAPAPTGSEYIIVTDGDTELRLCRMWLQARGDWQNWMDVCFDAETGDVYYFYVSRECLTNRLLYAQEIARHPTVETVAERLAEERSCRLRYIQGGENGSGTAILTADEGTLCFEISCVYYDALIDIRINCV